MTEKSKLAFENLGRATMRGIRKCPKCGTLNGTRGLSCKNKACRLLFKLPKEKITLNPEVDAAKIISNTELQIYTVKFAETNDNVRCFVHLPIIEGIEALQDATEVKVIKQSAAMCYASTCRKPLDDMGAITLNLNPCIHTQFIVNCSLETQLLPVKRAVVKVMPIPEDIRQEIYLMLADYSDTLVQRITKNTVVIRCNPQFKNDGIIQIKYPLGFLHFSVFEPSKYSKKFKILCDCQSEFTKPFVPKERQMCLHFYLCVCAFASDIKLLEEFRNLIQCFLNIKSCVPFESVFNPADPNEDLKYLKAFFLDTIDSVSKKKKNDNNQNKEHANEVDIEDENNAVKAIKTMMKDSIKEKLSLADTIPSISFEQWLGSVTERINQTMHYQFSGNPEPLIFYVPQIFFDIMQQRISSGSKKKRLPNTVLAFTRKDALPVGVFSKYVWHITNILHVKRIFDTEKIPLEVTQSFIENRDGTFIPCDPLQEETAKLAENFKKTVRNPLIKPLELKTFLKVGNWTVNQKEPTPFIIEWTPDVLPKSHVGELRIKFEYGHQRNGVIENRDQIHPSAENLNSDVQKSKS